MSLGYEQEEFSRHLAELIRYAYGIGYRIRIGDVWSKPAYRSHKKGSQHYKKLAADLNLFHSGEFLTKSSDHLVLGRYWESLDPKNRSGCRYNDGNHYERMEHGWRDGTEEEL